MKKKKYNKKKNNQNKLKKPFKKIYLILQISKHFFAIIKIYFFFVGKNSIVADVHRQDNFNRNMYFFSSLTKKNFQCLFIIFSIYFKTDCEEMKKKTRIYHNHYYVQ